MEQKSQTETVGQIMDNFAVETGLKGDQPPRRYLWTDAFAVCNYLELYARTGDEQYQSLAFRLVDQVHQTLGKHRAGDARRGWISGLSEEEGQRHPTRGGLRIGKKLPERGRDEPADRRTEWDRDGQYYHYLTKWMHALNRVGRVTGDATYLRWAVELAQAAHEAFVYQSPVGSPARMVWKMSIDLSYPLVPSMGHHDPLDGLITYHELKAALEDCDAASAGLNLDSQIAELAEICRRQSWTTDDPLGLGGLLADAFRVAQLLAGGYWQPEALLTTLLKDAHSGLRSYAGQRPLSLPASQRLAFRELGLSIGLHAVERLQELAQTELEAMVGAVDTLTPHLPLAQRIEQFWLQPSHRESQSWQDHRDINRVMLATSLAPDNFLRI